MTEEIKLMNEIIAMAIIHGGDAGGPYEFNTVGLVTSINKWLREKGLKEQYHVISTSYNYTVVDSIGEDNEKREYKGIWPVLQIAPIDETGDDYSAIYQGNLDDIP